MKKMLILLLTLAIVLSLCGCKPETCVNCDHSIQIEYDGDGYCYKCYNNIPGVEPLCVNCGELAEEFRNVCEDCRKESDERAASIAQDLWGQE